MWNDVSWMKSMPTSAAVGWQTVQESPTPYRVMLQRMAWWRPGSGPGWNCASQGDSACPGWIEDIKCLKITYAGCCSSKNIGVTNDKFYFATTRDLAHLFEINPSHKSTNASDKYSTIHHFVTEICTHVQISVIKWRFVGYLSNALWDLCNKSITICQRVSNTTRSRYLTFSKELPKCSQNSSHVKTRYGMPLHSSKSECSFYFSWFCNVQYLVIHERDISKDCSSKALTHSLLRCSTIGQNWAASSWPFLKDIYRVIRQNWGIVCSPGWQTCKIIIRVNKTVTVMSHERHGVSIYQQLDYLFNRLFQQLNIKAHALLALWGHSICDRWIPHKGPVI